MRKSGNRKSRRRKRMSRRRIEREGEGREEKEEEKGGGETPRANNDQLKVMVKLEVEEVGVGEGVGEGEGEAGSHRAFVDYITFLSSPVDQELQSSNGTDQLDAQDVTNTEQTCVGWTMFDMFPGLTKQFQSWLDIVELVPDGSLDSCWSHLVCQRA